MILETETCTGDPIEDPKWIVFDGQLRTLFKDVSVNFRVIKYQDKNTRSILACHNQPSPMLDWTKQGYSTPERRLFKQGRHARDVKPDNRWWRAIDDSVNDIVK